MGSSYGNRVKTSIFGQSHSEAIGVVIDGLPAGIEIDMEKLQAFMDRRAPGKTRFATARKEADAPKFLSGLVGNVTCGAPLCAVIENTDTRSKDYDNIRDLPRPGHADFTARVKFGGSEDVRGGGHFSGRLTAPLCIAGGIYLQILEKKGVTIETEILEIGGKTADIYDEIDRARMDLDSVGGIVRCTVKGLPAGLGDPMFDGIENRISAAVFGVPAVKGIQFGSGFDGCRMRGSENNDEFYMDDEGNVKTRTNNHGGILGGITSGMDVVFDVGIKPTPSIGRPQKTVSFERGEDALLEIKGRHDPCIVPRALPVIEAAAAMALIEYFV